MTASGYGPLDLKTKTGRHILKMNVKDLLEGHPKPFLGDFKEMVTQTLTHKYELRDNGYYRKD